MRPTRTSRYRQTFSQRLAKGGSNLTAGTCVKPVFHTAQSQLCSIGNLTRSQKTANTCMMLIYYEIINI
jgi:hypothetical protein